MSIIKVLSENLVNQIAAGEVVERPASVVKELVENSLDAGADKISIEVKDGGKTLIRITDNGKGMNREDLEMSVQRHATSKITDEKDLWKITTMGFRGEALASIASVSKFTIKTKESGSVAGYQLDSNGGETVSIQEVGMSDGTQIEINDLFFNTPARQKYLKKDSTELSHITSSVNTVALANPGISFKVIHNGKIVSDYPKSSDLLSRIAAIFGNATSDAMIPLYYGGTDIGIDGFVGKPAISRSSSQHQYFFVNGRPIQHFVLANTIKSAFHSMLMENKKPVFVINIQIDPALIDVNVHPRKIEIRFEDQQYMIRTIYNVVKTAVEKADLIPKGFTESRRYMSESFPVRRPEGDSSPMSFSSKDVHQNMMDFSSHVSSDRDVQPLEEEDVSIKAITQVANSYIVAQNSEGLVLIDQHAAHERVRYEELMNEFENQKKSIQPLLVPLQMELSGDEKSLIEDNLEVFSNLGFEIEEFGGNTFIVRGTPACLASEDLDSVIKGVLDDIIEQRSPSKFQGKVEEILTYMSCRSAIKFGKPLTLGEMQSLIDQMEDLKRPYTCPHGRPTMVSLTLGELEKMFGRK